MSAKIISGNNKLTKVNVFDDVSICSTACGAPIRIVHFNDVYNIEPSSIEPKAGAARFLTAVNCLKQEAPCLVFFSGDAFSPSSCKLNFFFNLIKFF